MKGLDSTFSPKTAVRRTIAAVAVFALGLISANAQIRPGGITPVSRVYYHNGPLMSEPAVYVIWYGNWAVTNKYDNPAGQQIIRDFLHAVGGSPYYSMNTTFSTSSNVITGSVLFGGETTDAGSQGKVLTDAKVFCVVTNAIASGALPNDLNGVFFVLSSSDVYESSGFCGRYCGFHDNRSLAGTDIKYAFIGSPVRCLRNCTPQLISPNGNPAADGMASTIAHELTEMVTDPNGNAWYDLSNSEVADKCAWTYGHHQYRAPNKSWANVGWDFYDRNGALQYHRNFLIQRSLVRGYTKTGMQVNYCAISYDPATGNFQQ